MQLFGPFDGCMNRLLLAHEKGILSGFIPAFEAETLLKGKQIGTYLFRYSKSRPGSFALAFVNENDKGRGEIKHCMLYGKNPGFILSSEDKIYDSLIVFVSQKTRKLKFPIGRETSTKWDAEFLNFSKYEEQFLGEFSKMKITNNTNHLSSNSISNDFCKMQITNNPITSSPFFVGFGVIPNENHCNDFVNFPKFQDPRGIKPAPFANFCKICGQTKNNMLMTNCEHLLSCFDCMKNFSKCTCGAPILI